MKALSFSLVSLLVVLTVGLTVCWSATQPIALDTTQQAFVGGEDECCCDDNSEDFGCDNPVVCGDWHVAQGDGDNYVHSKTYCDLDESCETKHGTTCKSWIQ